jgi:Protein of unknown function (DUF2723)
VIRVPPFPVVLGGALALYLFTLGPGVLWGDSAKLSIYALDGTPAWSNVVGGHPLHTLIAHLLGKLIPFSDYARRINAVSAIFGALTCALIAQAVTLRTRSAMGGLFAGISLAVSHTVWTLSVIAESYSLAAFFIASSVFALCMADSRDSARWRFVAGLAPALGLLANALLAFVIPGLCVAAGAQAGMKGCLQFMGGAAVGALAALGMFFAMGEGSLVASVVMAASVFMTGGSGGRELLRSIAYVLFQFPGPMALASAIGLWVYRRDRFTGGVAIGGLTVLLFASAYAHQRHFNLLIAVYVLVATVGGLAWKHLPGSRRHHGASLLVLQALLPPLMYAVSPAVYERIGYDVLRARPAPGRDAAYFLVPGKNTRTEVEEWADRTLREVPESGLIYADFTLARPLLYLQKWRGLRKDVTILETDPYLYNQTARFVQDVETGLASRPVVLAQDYEPYYMVSALRARLTVEPCGSLFCVRRR